ncbi:uncharacterized protein V6R79_003817 [Siganus canaliculatus]
MPMTQDSDVDNGQADMEIIFRMFVVRREEMKKLPETAPEVHEALMAGAFVGRRVDGRHNGVSPDMLLEQTYNADAKESSGLDGITLNPASRMAGVETNPFKTATPYLINITTGQCADSTVKDNLTNVKLIGLKALSQSLSSDQKKTSIVKLNTFHTQNTKSKVVSGGKTSAPGKSNEVTALLRMTQIIARGGELNIVDFIGNHECSEFPPSLFQEDGSMRTGTKASLLKILKEESKVNSIPNLLQDGKNTAVVVDAMYAMYSGTSLKSAEQEKRYARSAKVYAVSEQFTAPDPKEFFAVSSNKANFLNFLCDNWCETEKLEPVLGSTHLYLGGGFKEETKSVVLTEGSVMHVPALESTQQEADTRIILHTLYSVQNEGVDRVVIHVNDTDVIVMCLYYGATHLSSLTELWSEWQRYN